MEMPRSLPLSAAILSIASGTVALLPLPASASALEEVVVTARKREENLQQTPVSVTALTAENLSQANISELTAIEKQTPNLSFTVGQGGGGSTVNAFIRGVGEVDFIITTDPAVGLYLDGVYMSRVFGANMELADVERVEVLRGPQGTLFGKNSIGGAINITTRKPSGELSGEISGTVGSYDHRGVSFYGQTALTDTLAGSLSYLRKRADGWQKRPGEDAGETNVSSARAILRWTPTEAFESLLSVDWMEQDQTGYPNVIVAFADVSPFSNLWNALNPGQPCCTPNSNIDRSNASGPLPNDNVDASGVNWTNSWQLGDSQIKSITSYRSMQALFGRDGDNAPFNYSGDIHDQDHEQFSQELQLTGAHGALNWVLGAYYFDEQSRDDTALIIIEGLGTSVGYYNVQDTTSKGLYAHAGYALTDRLEVYGGIRYTHERKQFRQSMTSHDFGTPFVFAIPGQPAGSCSFDAASAHFDCAQDWSETSPKIGVMYQVTPDFMGYAHVSTGFRSGGYNGRAFGSPADVQEYKPENLISYEAGFKSELLSNTLRLNGAVFYNDYEDIQVLVVRGASVAIENASNAAIYGAELEATWLPTDNWRLFTGIGYIRDNSDGWVDLIGDFTNTQLKHTPDWSITLSSEYTVDLAQAGKLLLRADLKYKSDYYVDDVNTEALHAPGHSMVGASIVYTSPAERWEVALHGENLTDKRIINAGFDGTGFFGYVEGYYNPPRRYYLSTKYRF